MSDQLPEAQHDEVVDATIPGRLLVVLAGLFFVGVLALVIWGIVRFTRGGESAQVATVSEPPASSASAGSRAPAPSSAPTSRPPVSTPPPSTPPVVVRRAPVVVPTPVKKPITKPSPRPAHAPVVVTTTGPTTVGFSREDIGYSTIVAIGS